MNFIKQFNSWFDSLDNLTRLISSVIIVMSIALIGAFVFHSLMFYFVAVMIIIGLRQIR